MTEAWNKLLSYGLPDGAPRPPPRVADFDVIRGALGAIDPSALGGVDRTILLAWLAGWRHHWPSRFARELGPLGEGLLATLHGQPIDRGRYLKLRRIAIENLAAVL